MIGWDAQGQFHTDDFAGQVRQALQNIVAVLAEAGALPEHIVRMNWYVLDKKEYVAAYPHIGVAYRDIIGKHFPAMTVVQVPAVQVQATGALSAIAPSSASTTLSSAPSRSRCAAIPV